MSLAVRLEIVTVPAVPANTASLSVPEFGQTTSALPLHQFEVVFESHVPVPPWAPEVVVSEPSHVREPADAWHARVTIKEAARTA